MNEAEIEYAQTKLPEWANSADARIHAWRIDVWVLVHPDHPPMIWRARGTAWEPVDEYGLRCELRDDLGV